MSSNNTTNTIIINDINTIKPKESNNLVPNSKQNDANKTVKLFFKNL